MPGLHCGQFAAWYLSRMQMQYLYKLQIISARQAGSVYRVNPMLVSLFNSNNNIPDSNYTEYVAFSEAMYEDF